MNKTNTTELSKIQEVHEDSQRIGEFLEWLSEQEIDLVIWDEDAEEGLIPLVQNRELLLAEYFGIDLVKAEKERQALLDAIRAENEA